MTARAAWPHHIAPGWKLAGLALAGTLLLATREPAVLLAALAATVGLYRAARVSAAKAGAQLRPLLPLLVILFGAGLALDGWTAAATGVLRLAVLVLLAAFVTMTTSAAAMTDALAAGLRPLARLGLRPRAVAFALALALRFLPLLAERTARLREAQRARGSERGIVRLAVPLIVQSLAAADDLAEAVEARGFDARAD